MLPLWTMTDYIFVHALPWEQTLYFLVAMSDSRRHKMLQVKGHQWARQGINAMSGK